jgi:hypothetical protein
MSLSMEIPYFYSPYWIGYKIMESCYGLFNKIDGLRCDQDDGHPRYYENGNCFMLRFKGINNAPQAFEVVSAEDSPLGGVDLKFT